MSGVTNLLGQLAAAPLPANLGGTGNNGAAPELARLGALAYGGAQTLTPAQQMQALANAGATFVGSQPINFSLGATVSGNALTISILTAAGATPSATNPVLIPFRTAGGVLSWLAVTSALSLTVPSGATLGTRGGVLGRVWIVALANNGAVSLGLQVCTDGATAVYPLGQSYPRTSVAISSSAGTAGTLYAASAVTGPITVLGCLEATEATAGTWATAPSAVRRWMPGDKLPGDIEQVVTASNTTANNYNSNAYPTNGGFTGIGAQIAPVSAANAVRIRAGGGFLSNPGTNSLGAIRLTRGSTLLTLAEGGEYFFANGSSWGASSSMQMTPTLEALDWPATTSATAYGTQLRNGDNSSNLVYPNGGVARIILEELVV